MVTRLEARALGHRYPRDSNRAGEGPAVLSEVDLALEGGGLICLLGPNGAGKSTLLRILTGILQPSEGEVRLDGEGLSRIGARRRARRVARVPQGLDSLPEIDVAAFVLGGRYPHLGSWGRARAGDRRAVEEALAAADVGDLATRSLARLSGGQRQRVLVARALAQETDWLLVDEPTASLDPEHAVAIFALLAGLARAGRGVVVATHELALAGRFADRVLLLEEGRLVASGPVAEVLTREVLVPVYGPTLHFVDVPTGEADGATRPVVVPWLSGSSAPSTDGANSPKPGS